MLTYELKKTPGMPLYEALYRCIRDDILSGTLAPGEKLPSKRALAQNLEVSKITVEGAYSQLLAEGYIRAKEKVGYFVEAVTQIPKEPVVPTGKVEANVNSDSLDLTGHGAARFPFSVWSKLQREVVLDYGEKLLLPLPNRGCLELREAVARHLARFRGMTVSPENILIGAGTDFLYNLLIQLLGRDKIYAVEDPGYAKIRSIYAAGGVTCISSGLDQEGVIPEQLGNAQVLHISPSHHFPTGLITSLNRRRELLDWVNSQPDRWIIEDDYDTEFRFNARPMPAMQTMDRMGRVIYLNSFSKSLAPSFRISYMVLPSDLMARFRRELGFYACTVPSFEQHTLARFLDRGYFEKHINRMRKFYKALRNRAIDLLTQCEYSQRLTILEQDAGLHFLLKVKTDLSDEELVRRCAGAGIRVHALSNYYREPVPAEDRHCLVINYAGLDDRDLELLEQKLQDV